MKIELCKSNVAEELYYEPTVIEAWEVTAEEAAELIASPRTDGFFCRYAGPAGAELIAERPNGRLVRRWREFQGG